MNQQDTSAALLASTLHGEKCCRVPCICPGGMMNMLTVDAMDLCDTYWPDFHEEDFFKAICDYQKRERRFGKTSEQVG